MSQITVLQICVLLLDFAEQQLFPRRFACLKSAFTFILCEYIMNSVCSGRSQNTNDLFSLVKIDLRSTAESLRSGITSITSVCEFSCTQLSTTNLSCLEPITNTQQSSSLLNAPVSSISGEKPTLPFVTTTSTPQIQAKERAKTPTKKICLTQDIQQTQLEALKKESQKLDLEIENLLLAKDREA